MLARRIRRLSREELKRLQKDTPALLDVVSAIYRMEPIARENLLMEEMRIDCDVHPFVHRTLTTSDDDGEDEHRFPSKNAWKNDWNAVRQLARMIAALFVLASHAADLIPL